MGICVYFPFTHSLLMQHRLSAEHVFRHGPSKELNDAVFDVATHANDHMITARYHLREISPALIPPAAAKMLSKHSDDSAPACDTQPTNPANPFPSLAVPALLSSSVPTDLLLKDLEKSQFNVFNGRLHTRNWKLPFVLWWRNRQGVI
jgi:NADH dehydrogenase [ubiquinone] 1 alpha subcomplex assembly factor 6